jgi:hypothetical protein
MGWWWGGGLSVGGGSGAGVGGGVGGVRRRFDVYKWFAFMKSFVAQSGQMLQI